MTVLIPLLPLFAVVTILRTGATPIALPITDEVQDTEQLKGNLADALRPFIGPNDDFCGYPTFSCLHRRSTGQIPSSLGPLQSHVLKENQVSNMPPLAVTQINRIRGPNLGDETDYELLRTPFWRYLNVPPGPNQWTWLEVEPWGSLVAQKPLSVLSSQFMDELWVAAGAVGTAFRNVLGKLSQSRLLNL